MPNLENLRKQAKRVLKWHREGHYPVAAMLREHLPRFRDMNDPAILAAPFQLADAQEVVARRAGFENWADLLKATPTMSETTPLPPTTANVLSAEPQLFVADMTRALAFWRDLMGFSVAFAYGEPPFSAGIARGGASLNLRCVHGPVFDAGLRAREVDILSASITLDAAKPLFLEYQAKGVPFHQTLRTEPWGARTFIVRDPDDNLILFAGPGEG